MSIPWWNFEELSPNEEEHGVSEWDQFDKEDLDLSTALLREATQNSLDARDGDATVSILLGEELLREPTFRAAILPAAMRIVLLELRDDDEDQDDDPDSWPQRWFRFAAALVGDARPSREEPDALSRWIDRACSEFASRFGLLSAMVATFERRSEP